MALEETASRTTTEMVPSPEWNGEEEKNIFVRLGHQVVDLYNDNQYRVIFASYTFSASLGCAAIMYAIQKQTDAPATLLEAWYVAISCFSGCGLTIADITKWHWTAQVMMIVAMELGSIALCSAVPSMLRLRALWNIDCKEVIPSDALMVKRHYRVNLVVVWSAVVYWFLMQAFSILFLLIACQMSPWWSIFHTASGFNNAGFALDPRNFAIPELIDKPQLILLFIFLIPTGNTLFPVYQRILVWCWSKMGRRFAKSETETVVPRGRWFLFNLSWREFSEGIDELYTYPTLYYTHLFSTKSTVTLLGMWLALSTTDFLMFSPDYGSSAFVSTNHQWLQALFQTATVRTAGFCILDLNKVQLGHLMYWVLAMYLSSYPYMLTDQAIRTASTKTKEEENADRDLVIVTPSADGSDMESPLFHIDPNAILHMLNPLNFNATKIVASSKALIETSREKINHIAEQAQTTCATEIGWLYVACIIIAYTEKYYLADGGDDAPVLRMLFEVSSAYGTVGLSLSSFEKPTLAYSAIWHPLAQFMVVMMMYFGKFRGLPQTVEIDWVANIVNARRAAAENGEKITDVVAQVQNIPSPVSHQLVTFTSAAVERAVVDATQDQLEMDVVRVDEQAELSSLPPQQQQQQTSDEKHVASHMVEQADNLEVRKQAEPHISLHHSATDDQSTPADDDDCR
ncbi:cation transporter, putative [Bodo saltans]|uniref:Cation transporter, putative n=1 Tax=Bodo saltans TaxID=75058 RepID=A0A0S4JLV4_BODSA|nr:cation transporter, putative [Bodo saltans]|eukprot:CUG92495.1 cation transporter, putative [Bodo saltans]